MQSTIRPRWLEWRPLRHSDLPPQKYPKTAAHWPLFELRIINPMSRDAVAIIMLYTISMEIAAARNEREACKPLSMARLYATDLRGRTAEELGELREAAQRDLDAWHCKGQK